MAASDQITKLFFCASLGSAVYYLMLAFEALGWQDLMNEFQLCLGGTAWVALPGWHCLGGTGFPRNRTIWRCTVMAVYDRLWVITGYFYGVIHSTNVVFLVLITGILCHNCMLLQKGIWKGSSQDYFGSDWILGRSNRFHLLGLLYLCWR